MSGILDNLHYNYRFYLTKPNKELINELIVKQPVYSPQFKSIDELTFQFDYLENNWLQEKNINYDIIKNEYLILMEIRYNDELKKSQYFIISELTENAIEADYKEVHCFSYEFILSRKNIRSYKNVSLLYDSTNQEQGILNYVLDYKLHNDWTISFIDPSLVSIYRSFDISEQSIIELFSDLERSYNCVFLFDTVNNDIQIKKLEDVGQNRDCILDETNYLSNVSITTKTNELVTRYWFYGYNNISINMYNVTGQSYIDSFDFFRTSDYMSQSLLDALDNYDIILENNKTLFTQYLESLNTLNGSLLTKQNELATLNSELNIILDNEDIAIFNNNHSSYSTYRSQETSKRSQITTKENEISSIQSQIIDINNNINALKTALSYNNNFTEEQLKELQRFIKEKTISISNISDELTLYNYALDYIEYNKNPITEFSIDSIDILSCSDYQIDWDKIKIGDFLNLNVSRINIDYLPVRLVAYTHDIQNNSLQLEFSSNNERNLEVDYWAFMMKKPQQTSTTVEMERPNYNSYIDDRGNIIFTGSTINSITNPIIAPDGSSLGERGFLFTQTVGANRQMRIVGDKLCVTDDNWITFSNILSGDGLEVERTDRRARVQIKPNNNIGFRIQKGNGSGSYTDTLYIDNDGNAVFSGTISASTITGSTISGSTMIAGINTKIKIHDGGSTKFGTLEFLAADYRQAAIWYESTYSILHIEADGRQINIDADDLNFNGYPIATEQWVDNNYPTKWFVDDYYSPRTHNHGDDYVKSHTGQDLSLVATDTGIAVRVNGVTLGSIFYD